MNELLIRVESDPSAHNWRASCEAAARGSSRAGKVSLALGDEVRVLRTES
jgi:hypothetical protein